MDFKIIDDDLTAFMMMVEHHFSIKVPKDGWHTVITINDTADLVIKYNGYVKTPYISPDDCEYPEWMTKIGLFFKWLFKKHR